MRVFFRLLLLLAAGGATPALYSLSRNTRSTKFSGFVGKWRDWRKGEGIPGVLGSRQESIHASGLPDYFVVAGGDGLKFLRETRELSLWDVDGAEKNELLKSRLRARDGQRERSCVDPQERSKMVGRGSLREIQEMEIEDSVFGGGRKADLLYASFESKVNAGMLRTRLRGGGDTGFIGPVLLRKLVTRLTEFEVGSSWRDVETGILDTETVLQCEGDARTRCNERVQMLESGKNKKLVRDLEAGMRKTILKGTGDASIPCCVEPKMLPKRLRGGGVENFVRHPEAEMHSEITQKGLEFARSVSCPEDEMMFEGDASFPGHMPLPEDPRIVKGELWNGLRYVIMKSGIPKGRFIANLCVFSGSVHEKDGQQGLAHYREFLCCCD